jgi:hypothetical protein
VHLRGAETLALKTPKLNLNLLSIGGRRRKDALSSTDTIMFSQLSLGLVKKVGSEESVLREEVSVVEFQTVKYGGKRQSQLEYR